MSPSKPTDGPQDTRMDRAEHIQQPPQATQTHEVVADAVVVSPSPAPNPAAISKTTLVIPEFPWAKTAKRQQEQEQHQKLIRPFAKPLKELRKEHGKDKRALFFEPPEEDLPRGDEFLIHLPDMDRGVEFEEYQDAQGTTRLRRRSQEEIAKIILTTTFQRAYLDEKLSLDDLAPYRVRVAYRLVRELAELRGLAMSDDALSEAAKPHKANPDPWRLPELMDLNVPGLSLTDKAAMHRQATIIIQNAEQLPEDECVQVVDPASGKLKTFRGMPLLPPPVPRRWLDEDGNPKPDYHPKEDRLLVAYCQVLELIEKPLYIRRGSIEDMHQGRYGMLGLTDPEWVRVCFPSKLQMIAWEHLLIEEAMQLMVESGALKGRQKLIRKYGLQFFELETIWRLANNLAVQMTKGSIEDVRAIMLLRLEEFVRRAREALDLKAELSGLKQIAIVTGMAHEEKDDLYDNMIASMKRIADERRSIKANAALALPGAD